MIELNDAKRTLLAEYERECEELSSIITRLRKELGMAALEPAANEQEQTAQSPNGSAGKSEEFVRPGDFYGMTQIGAAKVYLARRGERNTAALSEIAQALFRGKAVDAAMDDKATRNLSSNLSKSDDFCSVAKGRWGLSEWYPNREKKNKKTTTEATLEAPTGQ